MYYQNHMSHSYRFYTSMLSYMSGQIRFIFTNKLDLYLLIKSHASHLKDFSPTFSYMFSQIRFIFNNKIA